MLDHGEMIETVLFGTYETGVAVLRRQDTNGVQCLKRRAL
jgi:hypothetical protein